MSGKIEKEQIEKSLLSDFIEFASSLSPGVRLKIQTQFPSMDGVNKKFGSNRFINEDQNIGSKSASEAKNNRKKSYLSKFTVEEELDEQVNKPENWILIYNLLEKKRKDYRKEKEQEILAHSIESKKRLEQCRLREKLRNARSEKDPNRVKSSKKQRSTFSRTPFKKIARIEEKVVAERAKEELKQISLEIKIADLPINRKNIDREDVSVMTTAFRTLNIDKPVENEIEKIWAKTILLTEKRLEKTKKILYMSDSILKVKSATNQTLSNSENEKNEKNEKNMLISSDQLDFSIKHSSEKGLEQSHQSNNNNSFLLTKKSLDLDRKIVMNSRRAFELRKRESTTEKQPIFLDISRTTTAEEVSASEKFNKTFSHSFIEINDSIQQSETEPDSSMRSRVGKTISGQLSITSIPQKNKKGNYSINIDENKEKIETIIMDEREPLTMNELLKDPTIKIITAHGPRNVWKNVFH